MVHVRFLDPSGNGQGVTATIDAATLAGLVHDVGPVTYQKRTVSGPAQDLTGVVGTSIRALVGAQGGAVSHVTSVTVRQGNSTAVLHASSDDLAAVADPTFPFANSAPPVLQPDLNTGDINFYVCYRTVPTGRPGVVDDGTYLFTSNGGTLDIDIQLDGTLLFPTVSAASTIPAGQPLTFTGGFADGADPGGRTWTWGFGDSPDPGPDHTASVTHTYTTPGTYVVQTTAEGPGAASGVSPPVTVNVTAAEDTSPPPTTATPGPGSGSGAPTNPSVGPRSGSGPVIGGVPTARPGTGVPGRSSAPDRSGSVSTATATARSTSLAGPVVGYVLSNATGAVAAAPAAAVARDDSASALRAGADATSLPGWLFGAAAVVVLAALGAMSERRRPATHRARPRRKR